MLIYDMVDPQELQGYVRGVFRELNENQFTLSGLLPNKNITDIEFRITQGTLLDQDVASVRAWDTPVSIAGRQGLSRLMGELPPMGRKIRLGEEERIRLNMLLRNGGNSEALASIYNDVNNMARAVAARMEMLRGEALHSGAIAIAENGVNLSVDFGRSGSHAVAPGTLWSNTSASTPLDNELAWLEVYSDTNGQLPVAALTSLAVVRLLQRNEQYKTLATFNGITPSYLSLDQINQVRAAYTKVRVAGTQTRIIPESKFMYIPAPGPLGSTLLGVTAEALELAEARAITQDQMAGMTAVIMKEAEPVATWTKVSAVGLPILANPNLTLVATVK
jgi:Phage major capsid protein E